MFIIEIVYRIINEFISLLFKVFPYFILGAAFGALLEKYVKPNFVFRYLNKGFISIVNASILGAVLPGCACATMPMAEGLKKKGAGLGTLAAFIMVSPLLSPQTIILTYAMLGGKFTIARIILSLSGAIILGLIFNYCEKIKIKSFVLPAVKSNGRECSTDVESQNLSFLKCFIGIVTNLGKYFLLGLFIASLLMVLVPEDTIPKYIGSSGAFAYLVAALLGIPVYICEGEEIPLTVALLKLGLGKGPSFTFLLGAVGTCIPTMLMAQKVIGRRPVTFYIIGWFVFAISSGLLFSLW